MSIETVTLITHTIRCDYRTCEQAYIQETDDESLEPYEEAEEAGWYVREGLHLCPDCTEIGGLDAEDFKAWPKADADIDRLEWSEGVIEVLGDRINQGDLSPDEVSGVKVAMAIIEGGDS